MTDEKWVQTLTEETNRLSKFAISAESNELIYDEINTMRDKLGNEGIHVILSSVVANYGQFLRQ